MMPIRMKCKEDIYARRRRALAESRGAMREYGAEIRERDKRHIR